MADLSLLGIDPELRDNGAWATPNPLYPDFQVKIRSTQSTVVKTVAKNIDAPELLIGIIQDEDNPEARAKFVQVLVEAYITDWKGADTPDTGEPIPWSIETGKAYFGRDTWWHMVKYLAQYANNHSNYGAHKAAAKN